MANQVWDRLSQITSNYKNSQQAPSLNNNQYSSYYSKLYPGLNEESYNKMVNAVDGLGLTGENRANAMNNYYRTHVKTLINDQTLQERDGIINQQAYEAAKLNNKDADAELRMTEAVQKAKKLWNLDATANDREVFSTMVETLGANGANLAGQYLAGENDDFLTAAGLKEKQTANKSVTWGEIWDNIRTKANVPVDNMKKWGQRTINELGAKAYKNMLKGVWGDNIKGLSVDDVTDTMIDNIVRDEVLDYQQDINERYRAKEQQNLDQDIQNYYNQKGYTKLLGEGDWKGFMYKSLGDAAQNREMPVVVAASVFQPEVGFALMATDTYARENQEAFENMLNNGATYEQAENGAVAVGLINSAVEVGLERLLGGVETRASKGIRNALFKNVQEEATKKGLGRILLEGAGEQLKASGEEGLEEIVQQIVQNAAAKTVNENQKLFEGVGAAFEGGFYNPMNLLAGGGNLTQNISQNKDVIREQIMDGAYNAGVGARMVTDAANVVANKGGSLLNSLKDRVSKRADIQNQTTDNVEVETTENSGIFDKVTDWGAEKITNTVSAQDKLYKAQEPRMNVLSNKKNLEKRRANSDRANQLIIQNGYIPTNTAERVDAHQKTINTLWDQVKQQINQGEGITVDQTPIINALEEYINEKKSLNIAGIESDISALEKELESLKRSQEEGGTDLPILENKKQVFNDLVDWKGQEASEVYKGGLKLISQEIGKIEDNLLAEIPGEFSNLKRDVGALLDTYEDVFKADMKNQRSKGVGLTEAYSRIEGMGDILDGVLGVFNGDGKKVITGLGKVALGKSLAKAKDVDFLVKTGFRDLAKQMGVEGNVMNEDTTPTTPTAAAPTTRTTTEITEDVDVGEIPTDLTATEEVMDEEVTTTPKKKTTKPTTPKQETKTEDNSDLREKIGDRFYNYLKEHADNVNRSRKTLAPVTIEELLTSGPYHDSTKFIDIYERDVRNKLDNIMYQIGKLDLPEVKLTKEQQEQLYELSALNMDRDMLRIKLMKEWIDKNPSKAGEKLTELTNEGADMVEQLEKAKAYVAEIEKAQENKEAKTKETVKPKKKTSKKTTKADAQSTKLDTKKIASDYMKGEMDWNKYQHLAGLTEEQALEKRWKFQDAVEEEWDKNQDYYNTHQSELVDKFHHLLK